MSALLVQLRGLVPLKPPQHGARDAYAIETPKKKTV
jgi:hypothetical protein